MTGVQISDRTFFRRHVKRGAGTNLLDFEHTLKPLRADASPMADGPEIHVFELNDSYAFRRYFDQSDVFDALSEYYVRDEYRFEVPVDAFAAVAETLRDHGFEPTVVDDPEPFVVVIGQYEKHADILKESVANWTRREHRFFLMRSPFAVEQAVQRGATPVAETEFEAGI